MSESTVCDPSPNVNPDMAVIYRERRAQCRPKECDEGAVCWLNQGRSAYEGHIKGTAKCTGCKGRIRERGWAL